MDRTQLCGSCDVGSIPTGGTSQKIQTALDFFGLVPAGAMSSQQARQARRGRGIRLQANIRDHNDPLLKSNPTSNP